MQRHHEQVITARPRRLAGVAWGALLGAVLVVALTGCQSAPKPIFPRINPPLVWPPAPDTPRIEYVGELRGEGSLHKPLRGWDALRAALTGEHLVTPFVKPTAVAVQTPRVFVADSGQGGVHVLNLETRDYQFLRTAGAERFETPLDVASSGDRVFVVDRTRRTIDEFTLTGMYRTTHRDDALAAPVAAAWDAASGVLWIADAETHRLWILDERGVLSAAMGEHGAAPGSFNYPTGCGWSDVLGLMIADTMNFRVQIFDPPGVVAAVFGEHGDAAGDLARPRDVAADSAGNVYVVDNQFENVQLFTPDGRLLMAFGQGGVERGAFSLPSGVTIDAQDRIWVADSLNARVQVFQHLAVGQEVVSND